MTSNSIREPIRDLTEAITNHDIRILVVDDDRIMRELTTMSLQRLGFMVVAVEDGLTALTLLDQEYFDLVMLDVLMPKMDGFTVLSELRRFTNVPVIMLTALNRQEDVVRGFELGADNYIVKPFHFKEAEARIQAVLRRANHLLGRPTFDVVTYGDLHINNTQQWVEIAGARVELTPTEFVLLQCLAKRGERPMSKQELLEIVWGYTDKENLNMVELAIRRLRKKIESDPGNPTRIVTVRGMGYKFVSHPPLARG